MIRQRILFGLKVIIIMLLMMAITMLIILRWKSDLIIDKVLSSVQDELVSPMSYTTADMNWFSHFPLMSIQIYDLSVGTDESAFIKRSDVDIVIGLFPLLKNEIIINQLVIKNGSVILHEHNGHWTYDIVKKTDHASENSFNTKVRQLVIENEVIQFSDMRSDIFEVLLEKATIKGGLADAVLKANMDVRGTLQSLHTDAYKLPSPFTFDLSGNYEFDLDSGRQTFGQVQVNHSAVTLGIDGSLQRDTIDFQLTFKDGKPEEIKSWLPPAILEEVKNYVIQGELEGRSMIKGDLSEKNGLTYQVTASLKNGTIQFLDKDETIRGISVHVEYDQGLIVAFDKSKTFSGQVKVADLNHPRYEIAFDGQLEARLLNLLEIEGWQFREGTLKTHEFKLEGFDPSKWSVNTLFDQQINPIEVNDLKMQNEESLVTIKQGSLSILDRQLVFSSDQLSWDNATFSDLKSSMTLKENQLDYTLTGQLCKGTLITSGKITNILLRPILNGTWTVTGIEMEQLLKSFANFDQTFITSDNLSGKANLWVETVIPFDKHWQVQSNQMVVKSAIDIREGRLSGMKAFDGFSKFIHLEDLQDIRFNQIRNYMLIEQGKIILPVMFIQSSALNLSISGEHGFDENIIYYVKLNAGQIAANKLKKTQKNKDYVKASKSGWINMYFALSGTTNDIDYQQYRKAVIAGFEQSSKTKDKLRDELVEKFGYDVYWVEPNEWEDIPEYE